MTYRWPLWRRGCSNCGTRGIDLCGVRRTGVYILVGVVLWTAVLKSGVHATLAGAIVGFFIPLKEKHGRSPAKRLEHALHPWAAYPILPLFAFANAGVSLQGVTLDGLTSILPLGSSLARRSADRWGLVCSAGRRCV